MSPGEESEWKTRKRRIDPRLDAIGWKLGQGAASPTPNRTEEHETQNGPADYVLWHERNIVGVVEAKKVTIGPQNVLTQVERYARGLGDTPFNFGGLRAPFLYSTSGEVTWFHDVRHPLNRSRRLAQFHTPNALAEMLQAWMKARYFGMDMPRINVEDARAIPIALPPIDEQAEIMRRVDALFRLEEKVRGRLAASINRAGALPQAILSKAFAGELVPTEADLARAENRDYETAEHALDRLRREVEGGVSRRPANKARGTRTELIGQIRARTSPRSCSLSAGTARLSFATSLVTRN